MYQAKQEQLARRQKMYDMLSQQAVTPQQTQMVSGRAVPQGWLSALSPIAKAMMAKSGQDDVATQQQELDTRQAQGVQSAMKDTMNQYTGKPAEVLPQGQFGPAAPEIKADPMGAAMNTATDPYLSQSKPAQAMMQQLMKNQGGQTSSTRPYYSFLPTEGGYAVGNNRTGDIDDPSNPSYRGVMKASDSPRIAGEKAREKEIGEDKGKAIVDLPASKVRTETTLDLVDELTSHPGMKDVIGFPDNPLTLKGWMPGTDAADFKNRLDQLTNRTFMEIFPTLKGGGQITEIEGEKGQSSINRMKAATSEKEFQSAAKDFKSEVNRLRNITLQRAGQPVEPVKPDTNIMRFDAQGNLIQ